MRNAKRGMNDANAHASYADRWRADIRIASETVTSRIHDPLDIDCHCGCCRGDARVAASFAHSSGTARAPAILDRWRPDLAGRHCSLRSRRQACRRAFQSGSIAGNRAARGKPPRADALGDQLLLGRHRYRTSGPCLAANRRRQLHSVFCLGRVSSGDLFDEKARLARGGGGRRRTDRHDSATGTARYPWHRIPGWHLDRCHCCRTRSALACAGPFFSQPSRARSLMSLSMQRGALPINDGQLLLHGKCIANVRYAGVMHRRKNRRRPPICRARRRSVARSVPRITATFQSAVTSSGSSIASLRNPPAETVASYSLICPILRRGPVLGGAKGTHSDVA